MDHEVLSIEISDLGDRAIVTVAGEIDAATAPMLAVALDEIPTDRGVVVDLANVPFMDSSGLEVLETQVMHRSEDGGSLHISKASGGVTRVLQIADLTEFLCESGTSPQ